MAAVRAWSINLVVCSKSCPAADDCLRSSQVVSHEPAAAVCCELAVEFRAKLHSSLKRWHSLDGPLEVRNNPVGDQQAETPRMMRLFHNSFQVT